ncbi:hypothetical protein [Rhizobium sp. L245/93]|uniref:hypothetical protein n=1 Tax=Rhizobium sp. L245/93 TaxID=2819998 RepID=UPI001ADAA27D|nr:hypothetical protein [Rhizobium sp. L245/93]MBO9170904.1 hypothetical protein [Rhizobium sp. L245/93]
MEKDHGKDIFRDIPYDDPWRERTKEGFAAYNKLRLSELKAAPRRSGYAISGTGQIRRDTIVCAYVHDPARTLYQSDDQNYEKSFQEISVSIESVVDEDAKAGSLYLLRNDISENRKGEDTLNLTLYMPIAELKDLVAEIRSNEAKPPLHVAALISVYQSEVEASLRDWSHPQTFLPPEPHSNAPARLMQVGFEFDEAMKKAVEKEVRDVDNPESAPSSIATAASPTPTSQPPLDLRSIKIALWVIAAATALRVLIH